MFKLNNKSIVLSLGTLAILALSLVATNEANAASMYYGGTPVDNTYHEPTYNFNPAPTTNPTPSINSISPGSSNIGIGTKTITITGEGFVPSSVARVNGSNRPTTFIDDSHLLVQVTGNDMNKYLSNGGFFITVWSGAPGGGYSNGVFFKVNNSAASNAGTTNNNANDTSSNFTETSNGSDTNSNVSSLASNAIFGSNGMLPSGIIQWIFFAILILLIVILARKIFGGSDKYHAAPMKHD